MGQNLYLIRHAEALHNGRRDLRTMLDPPLSTEGEEQARSLGTTFKFDPETMTLFSSPLRRTLQTALLAFGPSLSPQSKVIALAEAQETSRAACDTGSNLEVLVKEFADYPVDLSRVPLDWISKTGEWAEEDDKVDARAKRLREILAQQEGDIVLVTHGWFLHFLTQDWSDLPPKGYGTNFKNAEVRCYEFYQSEEGVKIRRIEMDGEVLKNEPNGNTPDVAK